MSLVLDSSITIARVFPDEWTPAILNLFRERVARGASAPDLSKLEVANILALSVRKGRMTKERRTKSWPAYKFSPSRSIRKQVGMPGAKRSN